MNTNLLSRPLAQANELKMSMEEWTSDLQSCHERAGLQIDESQPGKKEKKNHSRMLQGVYFQRQTKGTFNLMLC